MTSPEGTPPIIDATDRFRAGHGVDVPTNVVRISGEPVGESAIEDALTHLDATENSPEATEYLRDAVASTVYRLDLEGVLKVATFIQEEKL